MNEAILKLEKLLALRLAQEKKIKTKMGMSIAYIGIENFNRGIGGSIDFLKFGNCGESKNYDS